MTTVFADSVGLLALWNRRDQWHEQAASVFARIVDEGRVLVTTPFVLAECANAAARWRFRDQAVTARRRFEEAGTLIWPTDEDWAAAWGAYERGEAAGAGIVDHLSFQVMRRLGVTEAFTNDRHFAAAGLHPLF